MILEMQIGNTMASCCYILKKNRKELINLIESHWAIVWQFYGRNSTCFIRMCEMMQSITMIEGQNSSTKQKYQHVEQTIPYSMASINIFFF